MPSPKIIVREFNFSNFVSSTVPFAVGVVGTAEKGEINERTLLTTPDQLVQNFGRAKIGYYGMMAAYQSLKVLGLVYFVRVAGDDKAKATINLGSVVTFTALQYGTYLNDFALQVTEESPGGTFTIEVINVPRDDEITETYRNVDLSNIEDMFNDNSNFFVASVSNPSGIISAGTYNATGGNDGLTDPDYVGEILGTTKSGLQLFRNWQECDIYALAVPGATEESVQAELIDIASDRQDILVYLDCPGNLTAQQAVDFHNGEGDYESRGTLASKFASIDAGWLKIWNPYSDDHEFVPPSVGNLFIAGFVAGNFNIWNAMAGAEYGRIPWATGVDVNYGEGERDFMTSVGTNRVNYMIDYPNWGIMRFEETTLSRDTSAYMSATSRYLLSHIRKAARATLPILQFKTNNQNLWNMFLNMFTPFMETLRGNDAFDTTTNEGYQLVADDTTTTAQDRNEFLMKTKLMIIPAKPAKVIYLDINILPSGANFSEFAA